MRLGLVATLALLGCSGGGDAQTTSGSTSAGETSSTGSSAGVTTMAMPPSECEATKDCAEGLFCAAPYDPPGTGMGPAACVPSCVQENDLLRWCIDDASCCEGLFCREVDGFCEPPNVPGSTDTGTSTSTSTSGG